MTLDQARKMIAAAEEKARELEAPQVVAIVDEAGNLTALERMNGAPFTTVDLAIAKARTSAAYRVPTKDMLDFIMSDEVLKHTGVPGACLIPGGIPVPGGAIGVSGGYWSQDRQCAEAGVAALG